MTQEHAAQPAPRGPRYAPPVAPIGTTPAPSPTRNPWREPTRGLNLARGGYDLRYGASLVAVLSGSYLVFTSAQGTLPVAISGFSGIPPEATAVLIGSFLFSIVLFAGGFLIAPTTMTRAIIATALAVIAPLAFVAVLSLSMSVSLGAGSFMTALVRNSYLAIFLWTVLGWLIVRARPAISYLVVLLGAPLIFLPTMLLYANVSSGFSQLFLIPLTFVLTLGAIWLARALAPIGRGR